MIYEIFLFLYQVFEDISAEPLRIIRPQRAKYLWSSYARIEMLPRHVFPCIPWSSLSFVPNHEIDHSLAENPSCARNQLHVIQPWLVEFTGLTPIGNSIVRYITCDCFACFAIMLRKFLISSIEKWYQYQKTSQFKKR